MKKLLFGILFIAILLPASAQESGIRFFHGTWEEAVALAKKEKKKIFIDFFTEWCGPCLNMAQTVFPLPEVGEVYNKHFVCVKIDAEKGEGREFAQRYQVRSYPTYIFVNPKTQELIHRSGSNKPAADFIADAESLILNRRDDGFRAAFRILLDAGGTRYWRPELLYRGPLLPARLLEDPDSRGLCLGAGMTDPDKLEQLIRDVRSAVAWFDSASSADAAQPELFSDLHALSKRVLATVLRAKLCFLHAHNTGGIWFTQKELEPQIRLYDECMARMKEDLEFLRENWKRENLPACFRRTEAFYLRAMETTRKALHLPKTSLRVFPPQ